MLARCIDGRVGEDNVAKATFASFRTARFASSALLAGCVLNPDYIHVLPDSHRQLRAAADAVLLAKSPTCGRPLHETLLPPARLPAHRCLAPS